MSKDFGNSQHRAKSTLVAYTSSQGVGPERAGDPPCGEKKKDYTLFSNYQPSDTPRFDIYLFYFPFTHGSRFQSFTVPRFTVSDPWTRERGKPVDTPGHDTRDLAYRLFLLQ